MDPTGQNCSKGLLKKATMDTEHANSLYETNHLMVSSSIHTSVSLLGILQVLMEESSRLLPGSYGHVTAKVLYCRSRVSQGHKYTEPTMVAAGELRIGCSACGLHSSSC